MKIAPQYSNFGTITILPNKKPATKTYFHHDKTYSIMRTKGGLPNVN